MTSLPDLAEELAEVMDMRDKVVHEQAVTLRPYLERIKELEGEMVDIITLTDRYSIEVRRRRFTWNGEEFKHKTIRLRGRGEATQRRAIERVLNT